MASYYLEGRPGTYRTSKGSFFVQANGVTCVHEKAVAIELVKYHGFKQVAASEHRRPAPEVVAPPAPVEDEVQEDLESEIAGENADDALVSDDPSGLSAGALADIFEVGADSAPAAAAPTQPPVRKPGRPAAPRTS